MKQMAKKLVWAAVVLVMVLCMGAVMGIAPAAEADSARSVTFRCAEADESGLVTTRLFDTLHFDLHAVGDEYPSAFRLVCYQEGNPDQIMSETYADTNYQYSDASCDWLVDWDWDFSMNETLDSITFKVYAEVRFQDSNDFIRNPEPLTVRVTRGEEITEEITCSVSAETVHQDDLLIVHVNNISGVQHYKAFLQDNDSWDWIGLNWVAAEAGSTTDIPISLDQATPGKDYTLHVTAAKPGAASKTAICKTIHVTEKESSTGKLNLFMKDEYEAGEPLRFLAAYSEMKNYAFLRVTVTPADDPGETVYRKNGDPVCFWETAFRITRSGNYVLKAEYGNGSGLNQVVVETVEHAFTVKAAGRVADPVVIPQFEPVIPKAEANDLSVNITAAGADICRVTLKDKGKYIDYQTIYRQDLIPDENGQCVFRYTQGLEEGLYEIHVSADKVGFNSGAATTSFLVQNAEASENLIITLDGITVENHIAAIEPDTMVQMTVRETTGNATAVRVRDEKGHWSIWRKGNNNLNSIMIQKVYDPGNYLLWAEATYDERCANNSSSDDQVNWVPSEVIQLIVASDQQLDEPNGVMEHLDGDGQWTPLADKQVDAGAVLGIRVTPQQKNGQEIGEDYQATLYALRTQNGSVMWENVAEYNWNREEKRAAVYTAGLRAGDYKLTLKARKEHYAPAKRNFFFSVKEAEDAPAVRAAVSKTEVLTNEKFQVFVSGSGEGETGIEIYRINNGKELDFGTRSGKSHVMGICALELSFSQEGTYVLKPYFSANTGYGQRAYGEEITVQVMSKGRLPVFLAVAPVVPAGEDFSFTVGHLDMADISWQVTLQQYDLSDLTGSPETVKEWRSDTGDIPGVFIIEKKYLDVGFNYILNVQASGCGYEEGYTSAYFSVQRKGSQPVSIMLDGVSAQDGEYTVYSRGELKVKVSAPGAVSVRLMMTNSGPEERPVTENEPIEFTRSFGSGYYILCATACYTVDGEWEGLSNEIRLHVLSKWEVDPSALSFDSDSPTVHQGDGLPVTIVAGENASRYRLSVYNAYGGNVASQEAAGKRGQDLRILLMTGGLAPGEYSVGIESWTEQSDSVWSAEQYPFTVTAAEGTADEPRLILSQTEVPVNTQVPITVTGYSGNDSDIRIRVYLQNVPAGDPISLQPCEYNTPGNSMWRTNIGSLTKAGEYTVSVETRTKQEEDSSFSWEPVASAILTVREYTSMIPPFRMALPEALTEVEAGAFDGVDLRVIFLSGADGNTDLSFLKDYDVLYVVTEAAVAAPEGAAFEIVTPEEYQALD